MAEAFSLNRELDFVRMEGLRRATGRPPHEWDIYIIKELVDNALDADDALWRKDSTELPSISVHIEYVSHKEGSSQQLFVRVGNRSEFPVDRILSVFDTRYYTSRKALLKSLTRGALGNALKTLLGIPYALRNRAAGDWNPDLKPLTIMCNATEYSPRYMVDSTADTIGFTCSSGPGKDVEGTLISVGLDHFEQELPRSMEEIVTLARQYSMCNPHARFVWTVEMGDVSWTQEYAGESHWCGKFKGVAPVEWYSPTTFRELLSALYRERYAESEDGGLPVDVVCECFAGFQVSKESPEAGPLIDRVVAAVGKRLLGGLDIQELSSRLYKSLWTNSSAVNPPCLGSIGRSQVEAALADAFPIDGQVMYESVSNEVGGADGPFVIEAAAARLRDGKRKIWTAINFTPTYGDPFLSRRLIARAMPEKVMIGLRDILDAYGFTDDTPVLFFLHLISPGVEYDESSKTQIDHLPFRDALSTMIDNLLGAVRRAQEDEELKLEEAVFEAIERILDGLDEGELFVFDQLLERLLSRLRHDATLAFWTEQPGTLSRLRAFITEYDRRRSALAHRVARPAAGTLSLPRHPDGHFSVAAEQVSRELLAGYYVNKVLHVQVRELEPIVIENGWLSKMDLALLHNTPGTQGLREAMSHCVINCDVPILVLRNADDAGRAAVAEMRGWLEDRQIDPDRIVDLGLGEPGGPDGEVCSQRLVGMMPGELAHWLLRRMRQLGLPIKCCPPDADIRRDLAERFDYLLKGHLWAGLSTQLRLGRLLNDIDGELGFSKAMINAALDCELARRLEGEWRAESYTTACGRVVEEFFQSFMSENRQAIEVILRRHLDRMLQGDACRPR
jgi:hypothetical protein